MSATRDVLDDYSGSFGKIRASIADSGGNALIDFVKSLNPDYRILYRDIAIGHFFLFGSLALAAASEWAGINAIIVAAVGSVLIGYWIAYLQLFLHEGAHWGFAENRDKSDKLCNLLIAWLSGISVEKYRRVHFQHHRALGTVDDSEHTYFFPLNLVFMAKALLGIRALEVLLSRQKFTSSLPKARSSERSIHGVLVAGLAVHVAIVAALAVAGLWGAAAAWAVGLCIFFPFFGALRQLLEHRDEHSSPDTDYTSSDHGAFTRIFGDTVFARTFGGAGFNRHLLHHWEPTVSYTRLPDLERFLRDTSLSNVIESRTTTYLRVFRTLVANSRSHDQV